MKAEAFSSILIFSSGSEFISVVSFPSWLPVLNPLRRVADGVKEQSSDLCWGCSSWGSTARMERKPRPCVLCRTGEWPVVRELGAHGLQNPSCG